MNKKLPIYTVAALIALSAGWGISNYLKANDSKTSEATSQQVNPVSKTQKHNPKAPAKSIKAAKAPEVSNTAQPQLKTTPTVQITLTPVGEPHFVPKAKTPAPDHKHWNKDHTFYLIQSSVYYDLYDSDQKKQFRFPNFLNVDASGNPNAQEEAGADIQWQWAGDFSVIGVQQIVKKAKTPALKGTAKEFSKATPDSVRVYLYDVNHLNTVYELILPTIPKGLIPRIEGIAEDGSLSLAAVSPKAYNEGDAFKNDATHYNNLGVFEYTITPTPTPPSSK